MCSAIIGVMALTSTAIAKTAKECRAEWTANKAANQAKGITEKAYVDQCRADGSAEKPKAAPAATSTAKEKAPTAKETAKEKASTAKEKASSKAAAPAAGEKKSAKECQEEWRANKAANQAKGITEKAYVEECRAGTAAMTPSPAPAAAPAQTKMAPPAAEPAQTKMAPPATAPAKPTTTCTEPAPAAGKPAGANQFAAEGAAKAHCPTGFVVWANLNSKIYHFSGHADYGHTKEGAYMCETDEWRRACVLPRTRSILEPGRLALFMLRRWTMGLFDKLGGAIGQVTAAAAPALISAALAKTNLGNLQGS